MKKKEKEFGEKMKAGLEAFYNNQFRRNEEVLTILRKIEAKIEGNMLKKIEAFKYLYKEQFKDFGRLMKERDKELEDNDVYKRKIWHESLDLINNNFSNMLGCISELESTVNNLGRNQESLITLVESTTSEKKRPDMTFSKFSPCMESFELEPPNIIPSKSYKRKK